MQASFLIGILAEDRPDELHDAYADAMGMGPQWRDRIGATLKRLPDVRALLALLVTTSLGRNDEDPMSGILDGQGTAAARLGRRMN